MPSISLTLGSTSRGTAISMMKSGRSTRSRSIGASLSGVSKGISDAVEVMRISTSRHWTIHSLNGTTAQPPTACANSFARSAERLLTRMHARVVRWFHPRRAPAPCNRSTSRRFFVPDRQQRTRRILRPAQFLCGCALVSPPERPAETNDANTDPLLRILELTRRLSLPARVFHSRRQPWSRVRRQRGLGGARIYWPRSDKMEARNGEDHC